jgi:glycerol uptake facilitator-like aquaporin
MQSAAFRLLADGNARKSGHLGLPGLGPDVSIIDAVIMEVLMTFFLVLVIFGTVVEPHSPEAIAPLAIGLTITMNILEAALPGRR